MTNINFLIIFVFTSSALISVISTAEISHKLRHRGHHKKSQTTTETPQSEEGKDSNVPANIWALLASNALTLHNDSSDKVVTAPLPLDLDYDDPTHERIKCPGCEKNNGKISDDELDELRIEYVKNEILKKLGLNERPARKEVVLDELPEPIQDMILGENFDDDSNLNMEEYYAKTTQKIVFLTHETDKCRQLDLDSNQPAVCFSLQLPSDMDYGSIESAQLWVFKKQNDLKHVMNHTLLLSEVNNTIGHLKPISFIQTNSNNHDWEKMDVATSIKEWLENWQFEHLIRLTCDDCKSDLMPIEIYHDFKPFIVIDTKPLKNLNRKRRSVNCNPDSNECCRDALYIDFSLLGWSDWIISPKGYHAHFCRGSCNGVASITKTVSGHGAIFNRFMHATDANTKKYEMIPCCTPTKYDSLEMIVLDNNNTASKHLLPNMIVKSCGCS